MFTNEAGDYGVQRHFQQYFSFVGAGNLAMNGIRTHNFNSDRH